MAMSRNIVTAVDPWSRLSSMPKVWARLCAIGQGYRRRAMPKVARPSAIDSAVLWGIRPAAAWGYVYRPCYGP